MQQVYSLSCRIVYAHFELPFFFLDNQVIKELTDGGADYCFECVGLASLMQEAFRSSREVLSVSLIICYSFWC
jgi:threonine dehydrogenase-like Zn-dependent dehydrogenase